MSEPLTFFEEMLANWVRTNPGNTGGEIRARIPESKGKVIGAALNKLVAAGILKQVLIEGSTNHRFYPAHR